LDGRHARAAVGDALKHQRSRHMSLGPSPPK
jgi:hypothetical protein